MSQIRVAVVGVGSFGRNHLRVIRESEQATLAAVVDTDAERAGAAAAQYGCDAHATVERLAGKIDAAIVATPTITHLEIASALLEQGIDVMVEKPIASDVASADRMIDLAKQHGRLLQVGHLERFNPAVVELHRLVTLPLFFEIHRLSLFSPRSLDVDVVLDLMIHDIEIVLSLTGLMPEEVRAAGISILSPKVDIANVRLAFPGGCIANLTASRVSTERVRKIRLFQPNEYISLDYARQDVVAFQVQEDRQIGFKTVTVTKDEPLRLELESFFKAVSTRTPPVVTGEQARKALAVASEILDKIEEHAQIVTENIRKQPQATT